MLSLKSAENIQFPLTKTPKVDVTSENKKKCPNSRGKKQRTGCLA